MKKQTKKLMLNKKTISNLTAQEMSRQVGGDKTKGNTCPYTCDRTCWGRTCPWCWW